MERGTLPDTPDTMDTLITADQVDNYYFQKFSTGLMKSKQHSKGAVVAAARATDEGLEACTRILTAKVNGRVAGIALDIAKQIDAKERRVMLMRKKLAEGRKQ